MHYEVGDEVGVDVLMLDQQLANEVSVDVRSAVGNEVGVDVGSAVDNEVGKLM